ncbi:MAG: hypothetical protein A3E23_07830 [Burkholderiales bacterium RIFCSPHIGHO2_12_FULL_65_48]|nr:MAG: hypothetical protein A3E23_07830 [Burkholderiales bacterium RIFCSPHIGHO2_12_FULL_65_48]OGB53726.1 MAG: hypothetical protein A3F71_09890 [Burkholderiales bacterium RIFCSPLOWO2_12_FULL_64_33]
MRTLIFGGEPFPRTNVSHHLDATNTSTQVHMGTSLALQSSAVVSLLNLLVARDHLLTLLSILGVCLLHMSGANMGCGLSLQAQFGKRLVRDPL